MSEPAATWIAVTDEVDEGNQLGAAIVAAERAGHVLERILKGTGEQEAAIQAARDTGLLLIPEANQVLPGPGASITLLRQARSEGWRLMMLSAGIDSNSGELAERMLGFADGPQPAVDSLGLPIPPAALRRRVSVGTEEVFLSSGAMHARAFEDSLRAAGAPIEAATELLEWGAGCGRMTRYLKKKAPNARFTAADTDAEAIAWTGANLGVQAVALPLLPPTELESERFDLVVGHSVFSHLETESQDRWLAELARVTRSGGVVAVSFNGPVALNWHRYHPLVDVPASVEEEVARDGIAIWRGAGWEEEFYDGYHTTFHSHDYVREHWSRWFEVVAIDEAAAVPIQDIAVLRPR